jgi:imidazolonepropionase-like amidohydrolase
MKKLVGHLHASGVRIHAGTDTAFNPFVVPGASLHEEFRHLVDAGLSPEEVWVAATRNSGESLGDFGLGTLTEGAPADLLVFREDPTRDLAALATLEAVATQGRLYPKTVLDDALARHRAFFESSFYETESVAICHTLGTIKLGTGH